MKKFICLILVLLTAVFVMNACSSKTLKLVQENIAEVRYNIYAGKAENVSATFMSGKREKDYVLNGYATSLIDFGVLTFDVNNDNLTSNNYASFVLVTDTNIFEGALEQNPFDGTYVADIKTIIDTNSTLTATIFVGSYSQNITLHNQSKLWQVDYSKALNIAVKQNNKQLKQFVADNTFTAETYIKILHDANIQDSSYYWYVSFLGRNGTKIAVLINPYNGKIMADTK